MNPTLNMLKLLAKKKPCPRPREDDKTIYPPNGKGGPGVSIIEELPDETKDGNLEEAINKVLEEVEECRKEIKEKYDEATNPQMRTEMPGSTSSSVGEAFSKRFEAVSDKISEIKDKLKTMGRSCNAGLHSKLNQGKVDKALLFHPKSKQSSIYKERKQKNNSRPNGAGVAKTGNGGAYAVKELMKERAREVSRLEKSAMDHFAKKEIVPAIIDCFKGLTR